MNRARRAAAAAVAALLALTLTACGITAGTVTDKHHQPAWTQHTTRRQPTGQTCHPVVNRTGKTTTTSQRCRTNYITVPDTIYHPERWQFELRDGDGNTGTVTVSRRVYDRTRIGDYYNPDRQ